MSNKKKDIVGEQEKATRGLPVKPIIIGAVVIVLIILGMLVESLNTQKLVIRNKSGLDIESIQVYFVDMDDEPYEIMENGQLAIKNGDKYSGTFTPAKDISSGAFLMVDVKFAGKDAVSENFGYFTRTFTGKIRIDFKKSGDGIAMDVRAGDGLFQSISYTQCDERVDLFGKN